MPNSKSAAWDRERHAREEQERVDAIVVEFGGDANAMAAAIVEYRAALARLERAVGFARARAIQHDRAWTAARRR